MSNNAELRRCRYSAIDWLDKCQAYIYLVYKEELAGFRNPAAQVGTAVHEVLHEYAQHCFDRRRATDDEFYEELVSKYRTTLPGHLRSDYLNVCRNVKNAIEFQDLATADSVHIEKRLGVDKDFKPTSSTDYFSSSIDLYHINGDTAYAFDYKTSREAISAGNAEMSLQREVYCWLVLKHHPEVEEVYFSFVMSRYGRATTPILFTREDDLPEFERRVKKMIDDYYLILARDTAPKARPGSYCVLCGCMSACPAYHQAFAANERINSIEDAEKFCRNYLLAQAKLKHWEDLMKAAVEVYGDIPAGGDRIYGNKPSTVKSYNYEKTISKLRELGVEDDLLNKKLSITGTELKGICKKAELDPNEFDVFAKVSVRNSYGSRKQADEEDDNES